MVSSTSSVLLAAPHHGLVEGIRSLLGTEFDAVVMVSDEKSLCESAHRLDPRLAVIDLSLAHGDVSRLIHHLRDGCPGLKVILLSDHDEPAVAKAAMDAGANGLVNKREIATDLLIAIDEVLRGGRHFPHAAVP